MSRSATSHNPNAGVELRVANSDPNCRLRWYGAIPIPAYTPILNRGPGSRKENVSSTCTQPICHGKYPQVLWRGCSPKSELVGIATCSDARLRLRAVFAQGLVGIGMDHATANLTTVVIGRAWACWEACAVQPRIWLAGDTNVGTQATGVGTNRQLSAGECFHRCQQNLGRSRGPRLWAYYRGKSCSCAPGIARLP